MKLTQVLDGRWLVRVGGHAHLVPEHELVEFAEQVRTEIGTPEVAVDPEQTTVLPVVEAEPSGRHALREETA